MSTHSHIERRHGLPVSGGVALAQTRVRRVLDPAVLACVLLAAILVVLIANSVASSGADRFRVEQARSGRVAPINLPGGAQGSVKRGIIHAPYGYSPPGIWEGRNGPVLR